MTTMRLFKKTAVAASLALISTQSLAAGYQLNAQSATGLGRAFAGDAVIADNASVMARNAAGMALFDSNQFSGGLNLISTDIMVKDITVTSLFGTSSVEDQENSSNSYVPNIYYIHVVNDQIALGGGIYSNFGTKNNFSDEFNTTTNLGSVYGGTTEIETINYALAASFRVNEQLSFGAGLDIVAGSGKMEREIMGMSALEIDASGIGYGFNLGTVFELNDDNRFGLSYHYSPTVEATGTIVYSGTPLESVDLPLPDMLEFSGFHKIDGSPFAVHYSAQWISWSSFDKLEAESASGATVTIKDYKWKNAYHLSLGGTYYMDEHWTFRTGYMYDVAAQDELTSISVPDSDRHWFSAGASYAINKHTFDLGLTYLMGSDVEVTEDTVTGVELTATTHANAILAGVQYSYSF